jgi:chromosome segregation ATPase
MMPEGTTFSSTLHLFDEISEIKKQLMQLEENEQELKSSLLEAKKQLSYYRHLVSSMKKAMSPPGLKRILRSL